jgi:hypothetical protein
MILRMMKDVRTVSARKDESALLDPVRVPKLHELTLMPELP